jgi:glycosyltransferase involved in cell wall biosynthesis
MPLYIVNSNPFFSAVTDYSLQLLLVFGRKNWPTSFATFPHSLGLQYWDTYNAQFPQWAEPVSLDTVDMRPKSIKGFLKLFIYIHKQQKIGKIAKQPNIWIAFEGFEHTVLSIYKFLCRPNSMYIIRCKGQSKQTPFSLGQWFVYKQTHHVFFASQHNQSITHPRIYKHINHSVQTYGSITLCNTVAAPTLPVDIDWSIPTFLVVARLDPVKGYHILWDAIEQFMKTSQNHIASCVAQFVCVGRSENIKSTAFQTRLKTIFPTVEQILAPPAQYFSTNHTAPQKPELVFKAINNKVAVWALDVRLSLPVLKYLYQKAHFGIITSLNSESICRVMVEHLQHGSAVIHSNVGSLGEYAHAMQNIQSTNILYSYNKDNSVQLCNHIRTCLANTDTIQANSEALASLAKQTYDIDAYSGIINCVQGILDLYN